MSVDSMLFMNKKFIEKFSGQHINPFGLQCYYFTQDGEEADGYKFMTVEKYLRSDLYTNVKPDPLISDETDVLIAGIIEIPEYIEIPNGESKFGPKTVFLIAGNSKYSRNRWTCCYKLSDVLNKNN